VKKVFPIREDQAPKRSSRSPRAEAIVADAIGLITEAGYSEFSLRKVAARNGIKLASLQYHFKTKEELLDAVLEQVLFEFGERFKAGDPAVYASLMPEQLLELTVDFVLSECQRSESSDFFFQLWAMSCHDASAARIQAEIYALYRKTFRELIQMLNPALTAAQRDSRSVVVISLLEGLMLFISEGKSHGRQVSKIAAEAKQGILRIVMAE